MSYPLLTDRAADRSAKGADTTAYACWRASGSFADNARYALPIPVVADGLLRRVPGIREW